VKVRVINDKCQGHGRCYSLAPELFESDDFGNSVVLADGDVPAGLEDAARLAELNCPEQAVVIDA
jgi:ferredoxin